MAGYQWLYELVRLHRDAEDGTWAQRRAFREQCADAIAENKAIRELQEAKK